MAHSRGVWWTVLALALARPSAAQRPVLLGDLAPGIEDSFPRAYTEFGGRVYFGARPGLAGGVWSTDGTPSGTRLVRAFDLAFAPDWFKAVGQVLFFRATEVATGIELWRTDGTTTGTVIVKDIFPGSGDGLAFRVAATGGRLFFGAKASGTGFEPWSSDGTDAGTIPLGDLFPGTEDGFRGEAVEYGGKVFFAGYTNSAGVELWRSDATPAATALYADTFPGFRSTWPGSFTEMNGTLFYGGYDGDSSTTAVGVWKTDGIGRPSLVVGGFQWPGGEVKASGGRVYFVANDGATGLELWSTDGTTAGTALVKDICPGTCAGNPDTMTAFAGGILFWAEDGTNGRELWWSDGTAPGTVMLKDLRPGSASSAHSWFAVYGSVAFFSGYDSASGQEVWRTDGTTASTALFADVYPGPFDSNPSWLTVIGTRLYFTAEGAGVSVEPWVIDLDPPDLLRNLDVTGLDPLSPPRTTVLPLDPVRDLYQPAFARGLDPDTGVLRRTSRPLGLYALSRPATIRLVKTPAGEIDIQF